MPRCDTVTIFVHLPPCSSISYRKKWEEAIRTHPEFVLYRPYTMISETVHAQAQLPLIEDARAKSAWWRYCAITLMSILLGRERPFQSYQAWTHWWIAKQDRVRSRYHRKHLQGAHAGIFVLSRSGHLPYDMWRNMRMLLLRGDTAYLLSMNTTGDLWVVRQVINVPDRSMRLGRRESLHTIGEYIDPNDGQGFSLIELKNRLFGTSSK